MPFHPTTTTTESDEIAIRTLRAWGVKDPAGAISRMRSATKPAPRAEVALAVGQGLARVRATLRDCGVDVSSFGKGDSGALQNMPKAPSGPTPISKAPKDQGGSGWTAQQAQSFLASVARTAGMTPSAVAAALQNPDVLGQVASAIRAHTARAAARRR